MSGLGELFVCTVCGDRCMSSWTEEEALADLAQRFPGVPVEDCAPVCEHCDRLLKAFLAEATEDEKALLDFHPMQARDHLMRDASVAAARGDRAEYDRRLRLAECLHALAGRWIEGRERARVRA